MRDSVPQARPERQQRNKTVPVTRFEEKPGEARSTSEIGIYRHQLCIHTLRDEADVTVEKLGKFDLVEGSSL
jgi:hypothetical protein